MASLSTARHRLVRYYTDVARTLRIRQRPAEIEQDLAHVCLSLDSLYQERTSSSTLLLSQLLLELAAYYEAGGDSEKWIRYCNQAIERCREEDLLEDLGAHLGNLGIAYVNRGNVRSALSPYQEALLIARNTRAHRYQWIRLSNLGDAYYQLGDCDGSHRL